MLPISVTVGPLVTASATKVALSQKGPGAFALALDGAAASGYAATAIATAQAVGAAGNLTLDGTRAKDGVAGLDPPAAVVLVSSGNDTGITLTVKGTDINGAYQQEAVTGANASRVVTTKVFRTVTAIAASGAAAGTVSAGSNGVATLDMGRRILFTSAGDDSGITITTTGTDWNGAPLTQTVAGANASTATTTLDFKTVTSIVLSGATASTITAGTSSVAASRPVFLDPFAPAPTTVQAVASGTVNYTVQQTLDDPSVVGIGNVTWVDHPDTNLVGATATKQSGNAYVPLAMRLLLNSGSGSAKLTVLQASSVPL